MSDGFDQMTEDALRGYLTEAARRHQERFVIEERDSRWVAQLRFASELAGETVPVGDQAMILPDEGVNLSADAADRMTALRELARLAADRG